MDCEDCLLAFAVSLSRLPDSTCRAEGDLDGTLQLSELAVYFEDTYWGAVFAGRSGYVTWNTVGYVEGDEAVYYIGHVEY